MNSYETEVGQEFGEFGEVAELGEFGEAGEFGEFGESQEAQEQQFLGDILGAITGETEAGLNEAQEAQLATELLEATSDEELEQFLGNVFKSVVRGVGSFVKSPIGRALGGVLKSVAKKALPVVGGALGSMVAPGIGTAIGSKLGSLAGGLFEIQTEAMPQEQAEYEVARRVVRLAAASARHAAAARPALAVNPRTVARAAVARAARQYAPGIYRSLVRSLSAGVRPFGVPVQTGYRPRPVYGAPAVAAPVQQVPAVGYEPIPAAPYAPAYAPQPADFTAGVPMAGRWVRRGRKIIVLGA